MRRVLLLTGVLGLMGCHGPKGSPDGTVESFYSACDKKKYAAMADMLAPESIKRFGNAERAAAFFASNYIYVKSISATIEDHIEVKPDKEAVVRFACTASIRPPEDPDPHDEDCGDTYTLKHIDGKWYIVLPATQRFGTML
ncbi:nuclear transport factor 2 family protein [Myxococcaceae bacterium GXIMD 01537]